MEALYGADWLAELHGEEEEDPVHEEEEGHQVAPSTTSDLPPGLEQEPPCSNASGPYLTTALGIR